MKNKHESKIKYEAKGNPYLVISQKKRIWSNSSFL